jgi:hypothetical protein
MLWRQLNPDHPLPQQLPHRQRQKQAIKAHLQLGHEGLERSLRS